MDTSNHTKALGSARTLRPSAVLHIRDAATTSDPSWIRQVVRGGPAHRHARRAEWNHRLAPCHGQSQKSMTVLLVGAVRPSPSRRLPRRSARRTQRTRLPTNRWDHLSPLGDPTVSGVMCGASAIPGSPLLERCEARRVPGTVLQPPTPAMRRAVPRVASLAGRNSANTNVHHWTSSMVTPATSTSHPHRSLPPPGRTRPRFRPTRTAVSPPICGHRPSVHRRRARRDARQGSTVATPRASLRDRRRNRCAHRVIGGP